MTPRTRAILRGMRSVTLVPLQSREAALTEWNAAIAERMRRYGTAPDKVVAAEAIDRALGQVLYFAGAVGWLAALLGLARADASTWLCAGALLGHGVWMGIPHFLRHRG